MDTRTSEPFSSEAARAVCQSGSDWKAAQLFSRAPRSGLTQHIDQSVAGAHVLGPVGHVLDAVLLEQAHGVGS